MMWEINSDPNRLCNIKPRHRRRPNNQIINQRLESIQTDLDNLYSDANNDDDNDGSDVCPKQLITVVSPIRWPEARPHTQQSVINMELRIRYWYLVFHFFNAIVIFFFSFQNIHTTKLRVIKTAIVNYNLQYGL